MPDPSDVEREAPSTTSEAPLLSANVPQQVNYSGNNFIELRIPSVWLTATAQAATDEERS